jgi:hypothetical protein
MQISDPQDPEEPGQRSVRADIAIMQTPARQRTTRCRYGCERGVLPQGLPTDSADEVRGLDPEQLARRSVPPSTMSLLGPLRHLAEVERDWRNWILPGTRHRSCTGRVMPTSKERPLSRRLSTTHSPISLASRRPPMQCWPSIRIWASGWGRTASPSGSCGVHRIEEYARHCGHADLLRECIDGRVGQ